MRTTLYDLFMLNLQTCSFIDLFVLFFLAPHSAEVNSAFRKNYSCSGHETVIKGVGMMDLKEVGALISTTVVDSSLPGRLLTDKVSYLTLMPSSVKRVN